MRVLTPEHMNRVFEVTDALELSREAIQVPLVLEGEEAVARRVFWAPFANLPKTTGTWLDFEKVKVGKIEVPAGIVTVRSARPARSGGACGRRCEPCGRGGVRRMPAAE